MKMIFIPIASIVTMTACRISKTDIKCDRTFGLDVSSNHIQLRMTSGLHLISTTMINKAALNHSIPHVQNLVNLLYILRISPQRKSQCTQMQTMRIDTIPISCCLLSLIFLYLGSVWLLSSSSIIIITPTFFLFIILRIGKRMPAPIAHRTQRNALGIRLRE